MLQCAEQIYGAHYPMLGLQKLKGKGKSRDLTPNHSFLNFGVRIVSSMIQVLVSTDIAWQILCMCAPLCGLYYFMI